MNLPKKHLSFSQIDLWLKAPDTYRKKYYPDVIPQFPTSRYMEFGNEVTLAMEKDEEWVKFIPRFKVFEHKLEIDIDGIPILAFIDNLDTKKVQFNEQKTGMTPWPQKKVDKHLQLDIYSLLLQEEFGKVKDECFLVWVKTEKVEVPVIAGTGEEVGFTFDLKLTGEFEKISRIITQKERDDCRTLIGKVGRAIEEDYAAMKHLYQ